jgi:acetoin:2,6-dichlorophenolindophenol oxidoreductase subunit alpha
MSEHDPLQTLAARLTAQKLVDADTFERILADVKTEIDKGVEYALAAPYPTPEQVDEDVYA